MLIFEWTIIGTQLTSNEFFCIHIECTLFLREWELRNESRKKMTFPSVSIDFFENYDTVRKIQLFNWGTLYTYAVWSNHYYNVLPNLRVKTEMVVDIEPHKYCLPCYFLYMSVSKQMAFKQCYLG